MKLPTVFGPIEITPNMADWFCPRCGVSKLRLDGVDMGASDVVFAFVSCARCREVVDCVPDLTTFINKYGKYMAG